MKESTRSKQYALHLIAERCKGCGFCLEFCPQKALSQSAEFNVKGYHTVYLDHNEKCTGCNMCANVCPEFAIIISPVKETG